MSQEHVDLVRSAYEAYNRRDAEELMSRFDPEVDWDVPQSLAWGAHVQGLEALGRFFEGLRPYMGEAHQVAIGELIDAGDRVVALVRHQGTTPDGQAYDVPSIMVWTVRDGRIAALYEQLDTLAMARATDGAAAAQGAA